jgi:23S rRNA (pseudouridine1915-N3)-methyltransferase
MRIVIAAVGRLKDGPERELVARYAERAAQIGRALALGPVDIREISESRAKRAEDRKREEAAALTALLIPGAPVIALEESGKSLSSLEFASKLGRWRDDGAPAAQFLIGGADGLDPALAKTAALVLSFGRMTWPHQIVRALLSEQIYRAATILAGHPYHRE